MDDLGAISTLETVGAAPAPGLAAPDPWQDALLAARVLASGGPGIGGLWLKARAGGVRDTYLDHLRALLACAPAWVRVPASVPLSALTGSIDIPATALAGRLVHQPGLLARANWGVLLVPMAERLEAPAAALIGAAMDSGRCMAGKQDGLPASRHATRFRVIALDESASPEEQVPHALADRLGLIVDLDMVAWSEAAVPVEASPPPFQTDVDRADIRAITLDDDLLQLLSRFATATGSSSLRALQHLAVVSRTLAALDGRSSVGQTDALTALRLSLGLTFAPQQASEAARGEPKSDTPHEERSSSIGENAGAKEDPNTGQEDGRLDLSALSELLAATEAGTIAGLPDFTSARAARTVRARSGKSGTPQKNARRGRPVSISRSTPYPDARPHIPATLRAAAPWQLIRSRRRQLLNSRLKNPPELSLRQPHTLIKRDDYRYQRFRHQTPSTAIFLVDASGSTALERLGETKGAIEQLLARCYVRRDEVAMVAFRGTAAETVLPPTRSLVMAKRRLAGLPGGGPTPLVAGLERGLEIALGVRRQGGTPVLVLLTDGRGNIALDGSANRGLAAKQLSHIAACCRRHDVRSICIDIARRPREAVASLAEAMGADLHLLRHADAQYMSDVVNASLEEARG